MRKKHQQADGFTVYASKTLARRSTSSSTPSSTIRTRRRWLVDGAMSVRARGTQPGKVARFDWAGDSPGSWSRSRPGAPGGPRPTSPTSGCPIAAAGEAAKAAWRARLGALKSALEAAAKSG